MCVGAQVCHHPIHPIHLEANPTSDIWAGAYSFCQSGGGKGAACEIVLHSGMFRDLGGGQPLVLLVNLSRGSDIGSVTS